MSCCSSGVQSKSSHSAAQVPAGLLEKPVTLSYGNRHLRAGFHITEAKASTIKSLDCGSNRHIWNETVIQLLDVEGPEEGRMPASKFNHILEKAGLRLEDAQVGQVVFEIGRPDEAMQLFTFAGVQIETDKVAIKTHPKLAVCKPASLRGLSSEGKACCGNAKSTANQCCT